MYEEDENYGDDERFLDDEYGDDDDDEIFDVNDFLDHLSEKKCCGCLWVLLPIPVFIILWLTL